MQQTHTLRKISCFAGGLLALSVSSIGMRAQALPAMPPTNQPGQVAHAPADSTTAAPNPPLHADVLYTNGQLQIRADNSSLNQILRSISHVTGLKITGGVEEQRVFGSYGPAQLSTILATLLDGTGSNILLLGGNAGTPPELVLTSRSGGAMPPGPNSPAYAMYDDSNDRGTHVSPPSSPAHGTLTQTAPGSTPVAPTVATPPSGAPAASTLPVARAAGQPLTPEMVEQELLQMQAQQDQKKKELDDKMQQQQVDQRKRLNAVKPQNQSNQPPASSNSPQ